MAFSPTRTVTRQVGSVELLNLFIFLIWLTRFVTQLKATPEPWLGNKTFELDWVRHSIWTRVSAVLSSSFWWWSGRQQGGGQKLGNTHHFNCQHWLLSPPQRWIYGLSSHARWRTTLRNETWSSFHGRRLWISWRRKVLAQSSSSFRKV